MLLPIHRPKADPINVTNACKSFLNNQLNSRQITAAINNKFVTCTLDAMMCNKSITEGLMPKLIVFSQQQRKYLLNLHININQTSTD